ncbi:DUF2829 domain-containing protein [Xenorhabdus hominickii]|uniref:DUF2829 domain-containing protein n=1 Tax=Xenorhabdus hominickii TaxID=351679 RepID=A0A2G0QGS0_XENHO|nr:DUF2829 domain-containing protein [Xenorhabdus hominickii]AOM42394.1 hypothetical protein A9255_18640 [Xenorhabdus hominickii]PHM58406.1 hypothetical protein Xhom_01432 [Xenorhabdus hominickii]
MSEFIKPEHECPFDPKHYQCDCFIAPVGSFSWALIQLKLRKRVARSVWGGKGMYLAITPRVNDLTVEEGSAYAVDGVAVGTQYDYLTHIDLRNEHGNFVPWQPTQEDMMACDWKFFEDKVKPEPDTKPEPEVKQEPELKSKPYTVVFDITPVRDEKTRWGALHVDEKPPIMIENNLELANIGGATWTISDHYNDPDEKKEHGDQFSVNLIPEIRDTPLFQDLRKRKLIITVNGETYNLGNCLRWSKIDFTNWFTYRGEDAEKIGSLLKQSDKTFRFYCNWYE